jgi:hypothetical protein
MRLDISINDILFKCCGDDLIISSKNNKLTGRAMQNTLSELNIYLEFMDPIHTPFDECVFIGTHPVLHKGLYFYAYSISRLISNLFYRQKKSSHKDTLAKLCSITSLLYFSPYYDSLVRLCKTYSQHCTDLTFVAGQLATIQSTTLDVVYGGLESLSSQF